MSFHPFRVNPRRLPASACPFCPGLGASSGRLCNLCRHAGGAR